MRHRRTLGLWLTGPGALAVMAYTLLRYGRRLTSARRELPSGVPDGPLRELEEMAVESVQLEYGLPVMVLGAVLVTAAAMTGGSRRSEDRAAEGG